MKCYDIPRGNGKTLDDIINELETQTKNFKHHNPSEIVDDLKELRKAMEELE